MNSRFSFKDLLKLPWDHNTGIIGMNGLVEALPSTPASVLKQVFADHGRKEEFQRAYGRLRLDTLQWTLLHLPGQELADAEPLKDFSRWPESVADRAKNFETEGWRCIDIRPAIQAHWEQQRTWEVPPVLVSGSLLESLSKWRLIEGHTRIGLLRGLLRHGIITPDSVHAAWCGTGRPAN